jgi:hypothetical protein
MRTWSSLLVVALAVFVAGEAGGQIVLNEFLAAPGTDWNGNGEFSAQEDEWVELYNAGSETVDMSGYLLADAAGLDSPRGGFSGDLAAGEHLFFTGEMSRDWESANGFSAVGLSLNNSGDTIFLFQTAGGTTTLVDSLTYEAAHVDTDVSRGRLPDGSIVWETFDALTEGGSGPQPTPGGANGGPASPKILAVDVEPPYPHDTDPITVQALAADADGVTESLLSLVTNGGAPQWLAMSLVSGSSAWGTWEYVLPAQPAGTELRIAVQVSDGILLELSGETLVQVTGGDAPVVLNEILADPPPDLAGDANGDGVRSNSDDEFVEIYNRGTAAVDLEGWTLHDASGLRHEFAPGVVLAPGEWCVVFGGGEPTGIPGTVTTASTGGLSLNNTGDEVRLVADDGVVQDVHAYGSEANADQSLIRHPDGDGDWTRPFDIDLPWAYSPGASNEVPAAVSQQSWSSVKALYYE